MKYVIVSKYGGSYMIASSLEDVKNNVQGFADDNDGFSEVEVYELGKGYLIESGKPNLIPMVSDKKKVKK